MLGNRIQLAVCHCHKPAAVLANSAQIEQVLINLAVNARDAMPHGGTLTIRTSELIAGNKFCLENPYVKPGRYAQIQVIDTGTGMDQATQERIFEPFFTTKEVGKGTGIGLSMVYTILKEHNGYVTVFSKPGEGTSFNILLLVITLGSNQFCH